MYTQYTLVIFPHHPLFSPSHTPWGPPDSTAFLFMSVLFGSRFCKREKKYHSYLSESGFILFNMIFFMAEYYSITDRIDR
jgi:hypothetical protein